MRKKDELRYWDEQIRDLECRIEQEKRRLSAGESDAWGSVEVLHLMEQTLEDWRAYKRALQSSTTLP